MVDEVAGFVENFATDHRCDLNGFHMLGTSGTVTTIAGVYLRLRRYDRRRVDGCWLSDTAISGVVDELMAMSFDERAANPCIGADRADLVLAGCAILDAIRRAFPCPRLRVADRGLREGMLVEMMREDGVWGEA
jgi:exopolyphosphatase/guanosine-5'-triphosphate,3'-diphosphate pyrophosphatase